MKIFNLIHEQDTDAAWGCKVQSFSSKVVAQGIMRDQWQITANAWEYHSKDHRDEDTCECSEDSAIIRDGEDVEQWRIEVQEIDATADVGQTQDKEDYIPQYSVVVSFATGGDRGFVISADNKRQMLYKLLDRLGENNVASLETVHIGFLYMDEDIIP